MRFSWSFDQTQRLGACDLPLWLHQEGSTFQSLTPLLLATPSIRQRTDTGSSIVGLVAAGWYPYRMAKAAIIFYVNSVGDLVLGQKKICLLHTISN